MKLIYCTILQCNDSIKIATRINVYCIALNKLIVRIKSISVLRNDFLMFCL